MSDNYIKIAPIQEISDPQSTSQQVIEWMQRNEFIENELSKCGFGLEDSAYKPGKRHTDIIGYDENITRLNACGVEFKTGRQVSNLIAFSPMITMKCKLCGENRFKDFTPQEFYTDSTPPEILKLYDVMFPIFDKWKNMEAALLECPSCEQHSRLDDYEIEGSISLSNFEVTFWNWPDLKQSFVGDLEKMVQTPLKRMNGHI